MRNILIYSFVGFYFLISIRLTVNLHFCKDKFISASFVGFSEVKSCCKAKKMKSNCCKNVHVSLKKSNNDKPNKTIVVPTYPISQVTQSISIPILLVQKETSKEVVETNNSPPEYTSIAIYIKNCVFII